MSKGFLIRALWIILPITMSLILPLFAGAINWQVMESRHVKLYYGTPDTLREFDKAIDYDNKGQGFSFFQNKKEDESDDDRLKRKLDALFERVQSILDMRKSMDKVKVKSFPDQQSLWNAYEVIYKQKRELRAWYIFDYHTIYINVQDLNEGMLAHEMAHAIIDNFLEVRPPAATAEILARYVDSHLFDE